MSQKFVSPQIFLPEPGWDGVPEAILPPPPPVPSPPGPLFPSAQQEFAIVTDISEPQLFNGMAFPFGGTVLSTFGPKSDENVIRTSIEMILMTFLTERVMIPEFGSDLQSLLFEPSDSSLAIFLRSAIEEAIANWENRVLIGTVEIDPQESSVIIRIPMVIQKPDGPRDVNVSIELERETLYNIPFRGR